MITPFGRYHERKTPSRHSNKKKSVEIFFEYGRRLFENNVKMRANFYIENKVNEEEFIKHHDFDFFFILHIYTIQQSHRHL